MKRTIRILHLYPELLDYYGDGGNLLTLSKRLREMGHEVSCDSLELGEERDFSSYDVILVGAGKTRNLAAALQDAAKRRDDLASAVQSGCMVLATGTGMLLLGTGLQMGEEWIPGTGLFDYKGIETGRVSVSDCIVRLAESDLPPCYGFVNQTVRMEYAVRPNLFDVISGETGQDGAEGMTRGNCFATTLLGPLLAKNPDFTRRLLERLLGEDFASYDDALAYRAYERTMAEFSNL